MDERIVNIINKREIEKEQKLREELNRLLKIIE